MANPLEKFTGMAAIDGEIRAIWKKYGVSKSADLPPEGQDEVRAAVARWQKAHTNKLGAFMDKAVKPLGLHAFEKAAGLMFGPVAHTAAHSLVARAQTGDFQAKQAIGSVIKQAAGGDPTAQKALSALTVARQQIKAFGPARAECLLAQGSAQLASSAGACAGVAPLVDCVERGRAFARAAGVNLGPQVLSPAAHARRMAALRRAGVPTRTVYAPGFDVVLRRSSSAGAAPSLLESLELRDMYTRGEWIPTGGGEVFIPAAYNLTTAGKYARARARLKIEPRTAKQLRYAFAAERRGELPPGTAQRWTRRATMGFESVQHGSAKTLRESLGLNVALK